AEKQQIMLTTIAVDLARGQKLLAGEESGSQSGTSGLLTVPTTTDLQPESCDA
ncbi:unnamed protein product, partial [Citrullus colocynthis]